jgi:hypothetical protein
VKPVGEKANFSGEKSIFHLTELLRNLPRLGLRPERVADGHLGRNQQATQRLYAGDAGFWLLTSGFYILCELHASKDIKGEALV